MTDDHKADLDRVSAQNGYTDLTRTADHLPEGGGPFSRLVNGALRAVADQNPHAAAVRRSTDFGGTRLGLNQLLDLVEQTDPGDVESSGKALWDARNAIKAAAEELSGHIDRVHWVGESGDAFREWGASLVGKAHQLSDFAGGAGDQLSAAAVGLSSVRGAMPPRDTQTNRKRPHEFSAAEKTADKDGYAAAVRVEKDRQEAINQMNRLASYYAVSNEQLAAERSKAPRFDAMPDVGVPRPVQGKRDASQGPPEHGTSRADGGTAATGRHASIAPPPHAGAHDRVDGLVYAPHDSGHTAPHGSGHTAPHVVPADSPVGTAVDSVGTLPTSPTTATHTHVPPTPVSGPADTFESGPMGPFANGAPGGGSGAAGRFRTPGFGPGRTGLSDPSEPGQGRTSFRGPVNQVGRSTSIGRSLSNESTPSSSFAEREVTGGASRPGGAAAPRGAARPTTGAGRSDGVVGGRPTAAGKQSARTGSRLPRGTVVGAEEAESRPASGRPATRGVLGTPQSPQRPGGAASQRGVEEADGVTGRPTARTSAARAERNGMTRGGAGLTGGRGSEKKNGEKRNSEKKNSKKSEERREPEGALRPDRALEESASRRSSPERDQGRTRP
ncbi:hypothetical protein [Streptomyces sp. NPDC046985]|uniref:hypothetical protein n=1 Tax=Streptomyces sp. NPDC046985 TaxID=3155377 RepID=UPI0034018EC7